MHISWNSARFRTHPPTHQLSEMRENAGLRETYSTGSSRQKAKGCILVGSYSDPPSAGRQAAQAGRWQSCLCSRTGTIAAALTRGSTHFRGPRRTPLRAGCRLRRRGCSSSAKKRRCHSGGLPTRKRRLQWLRISRSRARASGEDRATGTQLASGHQVQGCRRGGRRRGPERHSG